MKNLLSSIILTIGMLSCASCTDLMKDDGSRGFANVATIVGDAENGFYCYQRHYAGLVVSHSKELAGKERGYFNFYYTEDDWTTSTNGMKYIDNAQVYTIEAYETVHPLTQEEADAGHITGNENCTIPQSLSIDYASYGYVDLQAGFSTFNHINGEIHNGEVNLVYDATKQEPDTLRLQLCYNPRIPDGWTKTSHHFRTVSCDISSLSSLQQWSDSLTLVIDDGSKKKHLRRMSRNDFLKPSPETNNQNQSIFFFIQSSLVLAYLKSSSPLLRVRLSCVSFSIVSVSVKEIFW